MLSCNLLEMTETLLLAIREDVKNNKGYVFNRNQLSCGYKLSEEFIREFQNEVVWDNISYFQTLSEDFIREFQDKVNWNFISIHQTLSEGFIIEFEDKIDFNAISYVQKLSGDFIKEFCDRISFFGLTTSPYWNDLSQDIKDYIRMFL